MSVWDMLLRIGTSVSLGALIGLERQYRAQMAGLRTNTLVAVGATLFVLLSAYGFLTGLPGARGADPTRVAAQIVSGIGFLGGGVILREGMTVRGLDTAATLWCSAAVGALAGAAQFPTAAAGTVVVLGANIVLRWAVRIIDRQMRSGEEPTPATVPAQSDGTSSRYRTGRCRCGYRPAPGMRLPSLSPASSPMPHTQHAPHDTVSDTAVYGDVHFNLVTCAHPDPKPARTRLFRFTILTLYGLITAAVACWTMLTQWSLATTDHPTHPQVEPSASPDPLLTQVTANRVEQCETQHQLTRQTQKRTPADAITDFASCAWPPPAYADADGFTDITLRSVPGPEQSDPFQVPVVDRITGPCRTFNLAYDSQTQGNPQHLPSFSTRPDLVTSLDSPGAPWPPGVTALGLAPDRNEVDVVHDDNSVLASAACQD
jgi:uncharacterized membrane protein YhiD involved in acid resistance